LSEQRTKSDQLGEISENQFSRRKIGLLLSVFRLCGNSFRSLLRLFVLIHIDSAHTDLLQVSGYLLKGFFLLLTGEGVYLRQPLICDLIFKSGRNLLYLIQIPVNGYVWKCTAYGHQQLVCRQGSGDVILYTILRKIGRASCRERV